MLSLTATDLSRFMKCNGSQLIGKIKPINCDTSQVDEGNAAHWLVEEVFKGNFEAEELIDRKAPNGLFITDDMVEHVQEYLNDVLLKGHVEVVTNHSDDVNYEIRGRADHIVFDGKTLTVTDFKYGWRIVEPFENWTLLSHAIGWLSSVDEGMSLPQTIVLKIHQPRAFHPKGSVRTWEIDFDELMRYKYDIQAALTNPSEKVVTGTQCYRCPSATQCPASQTATMNSIDTSAMAYNSEVDTRSFLTF